MSDLPVTNPINLDLFGKPSAAALPSIRSPNETVDEPLGFIQAGFCMTSLPHRGIQENFWLRKNHDLTLIVQGGMDHHGREIGVPYGSFARSILVFLQTEAIRSNSPIVELGRSMNSWMGRLGLPVGGKSYDLVHEQTQRITSCSLSFIHEDSKGTTRQNSHIIDLHHDNLSLPLREDWQETIRLSDVYFEALKKHPVPIQEAALGKLHGSSVAFDVYVWLSYRLHSLTTPTDVSWPALMGQFSQSRTVRVFRQKFMKPLKIALDCYPQAKVEITEAGLRLHPSPTPIEKRRFAVVNGGAYPKSKLPKAKFPSGTLRFNETFSSLARRHGGGWDMDLIADAFRCQIGKETLAKLDLPALEKRFEAFCKGWVARRGKA